MSGATPTPFTYNAPNPSQGLSAVLYSQKSGASFSVSCAPTASFTGTTGSEGSVEGEVRASGGVGAYPITLTLGGTTKDSSGNGNILVGQHCTASISGIPAALLNNTANPSTYQWSVSGPTFQTWQSQTPAIGSSPANLDASYEVDGPGPLTNSTAGWYWNETGDNSSKSETVSCTATITPPTGQGSPFSVTAKQPVTVWPPTWSGTGTGGELDVTTAHPGGDGTDYWFGDVATSAELQLGVSRGMTWKATVNPPNAPVSFGSGSLIITQVILQLAWSFTTVQSQVGGPSDGASGLDTNYPYGWVTGAPYYMSGDSPGLDLTSYNAVGAAENLTFEDYLMYFAPGSNQCVPLAHYTWTTNGTVSLPAGGWGVYPNPAGTITDSGRTGAFLQANNFPSWM